MNSKTLFECNRLAWNEGLEFHKKARNNSLDVSFENSEFITLDGDCNELLINKLKTIDFNGKTIAQMQCNNGRELLSLMKFGATKEAVGFDISDAAVEEAVKLAKIAKLDAKFVRTNLLEIDDKYTEYFDFIYVSRGAFQWFPDLKLFFYDQQTFETKRNDLDL